ncbi:molybdenum cofactor biosynthesis protein B [Longimicrobium sp.]|uniref:MogA/MoaB family molybdenum cofactor biosynthesis protein n=1 Tax=Longimicrobium sp. TaxID=2029185 RepID=UPI002E36CC2A|nr:molybdenum cofactor biosynthesis protein B [Longimicrobium sp.]HEX6038567.1 molybdenum cofactor biosynthesis protein B [Longimicrobium sp.]
MTSESSERHHRAAERETHGPLGIAIVTVSDSRSEETDTNGQWLREAITRAGHTVAGYRVIRDEPDEVEAALHAMSFGAPRIVIFNGGTGIAPRDTTYDVLVRHLEKPIPGFGELFRMLSWEQVGAAAMLSRATAGVYRRRVVFSVPGSPAAVRLAWERLIEPELKHLTWLVRPE